MSQEGKSDGEKGRHEDDKVRQQEWEAERRESHRQPQDAELKEEEVTLGFQEAALICSAAVTECHNLGGFNNTHSFLIVLEAVKSEIRAPAWLSPGCRRPPSCCVLTLHQEEETGRERE